MKVYILTGEPFPNGMAATNRIKCYAKAIKEGGLDCEVLVFRRTEVYRKEPKNTTGVGVADDIPFRYIGGTPLRGSNVLTRQINDRLDILRTEKYLRTHLAKGDVLFMYMGLYVKLMMQFMKLAHKKGVFCVRDLCEFPYGTGKETKEAIRLRKVTFEKLFPQLDGIISISDTLLNLAKKYTHPSCEHIKVPIMVEFEKYYLPDYSEKAEVPFIFHSGTLYQQKDGILGMIEAFGMALNKIETPIKFISTGDMSKSPHKNELHALIAQYHLEDKIVFTGYLSDLEMKEYLSKAKMVIINKYRTQQNNYCFSTKLGEYLAAAKPVVITRVGEAMNWLENGKSAYVVEPEDTEALADAIVHVFTHRDESHQIGLAGQNVCLRNFDYKVWSKPLVTFLNDMTNLPNNRNNGLCLNNKKERTLLPI